MTLHLSMQTLVWKVLFLVCDKLSFTFITISRICINKVRKKGSKLPCLASHSSTHNNSSEEILFCCAGCMRSNFIHLIQLPSFERRAFSNESHSCNKVDISHWTERDFKIILFIKYDMSSLANQSVTMESSFIIFLYFYLILHLQDVHW